jgi:septal ring factor EnvC (AmiA/AmiB activator)
VFAALRGKLRLPARGELSNRFGTPREDGGTTWKGLFIRAPQGEEVKAVAPGKVVFSDWMRGFGNLLIVDHGGDYLSIYGNNETLFKQAGENVASGDVLGRVGNSGGNPETGLYFELRHLGKPFDPLSWVKR